MAYGPWPSKRAYPFSPGSEKPSGTILYWDNTTPTAGATLVCNIFGNPNNPSSIPIREIYFPVIPGPIQFFLGYQGVPAGVEPDYTTQNGGCESVDFDGVAYLTLAYASGVYSGVPIYVFVRSLPTGPFRIGPVGAQVTAVLVTEPITNDGTQQIPDIGLDTPLAVDFGGTGTSTPQLIAGTGITITGTPFDWTISASGGGISEIVGAGPITVAGGSGPTVTIGLNTPLALNYGGTNQSAPGYTNGTNLEGNPAGSGIAISDASGIFDSTKWTFTNTGVLSCIPGGNPSSSYNGDVLFESTDGSVSIAKDDSNNALNFEVANPIGFTIADAFKLNLANINAAGDTATLAQLPDGTWYVEVIVHGFGLPQTPSDIIQLSAAGFDPPQPSDQITGNQYTRTLYVCGTGSAGAHLSVNIQSTSMSAELNSGCTWISLGFKAIRVA